MKMFWLSLLVVLLIRHRKHLFIDASSFFIGIFTFLLFQVVVDLFQCRLLCIQFRLLEFRVGLCELEIRAGSFPLFLLLVALPPSLAQYY